MVSMTCLPSVTVSNRHWPYSLGLTDNNRYDAERWCYDRFKSRNWRSYYYHWDGVSEIDCMFYFKRAQDASIFTLRWAEC